MFGRPQGLLGRHIVWVVGLLDIRPDDRVLEIGFGPGVGIALLAKQVRVVTGVEPSNAMMRQARRRNDAAIRQGLVELHQASADRLPLADASFDKVFAINSMQVWPDPTAGLREVSRVLKPRGRLALAFTAYSGQQPKGVPELITATGFDDCRIVTRDQVFCALAVRACQPAPMIS
jgi:ubiquinone/menaquinone biosynthesis C-methylase UbiE